MNFESIESLAMCLKNLGANRFYAKELSPNDNTKNQIYLGKSFEVLHILHSGKIQASSKTKSPVLHADLKLSWIGDNCIPCPAMQSKLVLYPQYPEVRLSGFIMGCSSAPSEWMNEQKKGRYKGRILFLGIKNDNSILAYLGTTDSLISKEYLARKNTFPSAGVLSNLSSQLGRVDAVDDEKQLLQKLKEIYEIGWIKAKRLTKGKTKPCNGSNCGGLTIEAELGIEQNSKSEPDYLGWEIKQHHTKSYHKFGNGVLTLLTPEPDGGEYLQGVDKFVSNYGNPTKKQGISYFTGRHICGLFNDKTQLQLNVIGFDSITNKITKADGKISLCNQKGEEAASWSFSKILEHWCRKHNKAAYIPSEVDKHESPNLYRYGCRVRLCKRTDPLFLLSAMTNRFVYYDPGIKLVVASNSVKRRNQFRIKFNDLHNLYQETKDIDVCIV